LEKLAWFADEPNWDPALLPSYIICKHAKEHVKVALSGLGGDEVFAGYRRHWEKQRMVSMAYQVRKFVPRGLRKWSVGCLGFLSPGFRNKLRRKLLPDNHVIAFSYGVQQGEEQVMDQVVPWACRTVATTDWIMKVFDEIHGQDPLNQRLYYDSTTYLPDQILAMVDRTSMAVSLEARVPFLDKRLVTLMAGVKGHLKIETGEGKRILKKILRNKVPNDVLDRPKLGFGAPIRRWLTTPQIEEYLRELPRGKLAKESIIQAAPLEKIINDTDLRQRHCGFLWTLVMLECWMQQYRA